MGSTLSFPILCLANLLSFHLATRIYMQFAKFDDFNPEMILTDEDDVLIQSMSRTNYDLPRIELCDLPVLINGDDILFRTNTLHYQIWKRCTSGLGFELSLGKNYVHKNILTINSKCFKHLSDSSFQPVPFLNLRLLYPLQDGHLGFDRDDLFHSDGFIEKTAVWKRADALTQGAINPHRALSRFLSVNRVELREASRNGKLNYFIPHELGGLGLPIIPDFVMKFTAYQRQLASYMLSLYSPLIGYDRQTSRTKKLDFHLRQELRSNRRYAEVPDTLIRLVEKNRCGVLERHQTFLPITSPARPFSVLPIIDGRKFDACYKHADTSVIRAFHALLKVHQKENKKFSPLHDKKLTSFPYVFQYSRHDSRIRERLILDRLHQSKLLLERKIDQIYLANPELRPSDYVDREIVDQEVCESLSQWGSGVVIGPKRCDLEQHDGVVTQSLNTSVLSAADRLLVSIMLALEK